VWKSIETAAGVLGMTVSIGLRSLSLFEVETALEAAWLVFQIETGGLKIAVGNAGEAAAKAFLSRALGIDGSKIYNLNRLRKSFPILDLSSPKGFFSVKVKGLLKIKPVLDSEMIQEYTQDLIDLAVGDHPLAKRKLAKAAQLLFNKMGELQQIGAWPSGFNPKSALEMEQYIRDHAGLVVPHDHLQLLRQHVGSALNARIERGLKLPPGVNRIAWVNSFVDRIHSMGVTSSDLKVLLEATKYLPKDQALRLRRELDVLRQKGIF
jgi:hypothetical protein